MRIDDALDLYSQFLIAEKGLSVQTAKSYINDIFIFASFLQKDYVEQLEADDLAPFIKFRLSNNITISTVSREMSSIKSFFIFLKKFRAGFCALMMMC